ncbi:GNAT family N-acetyltransferase [Lysobacter sp. TLK-CK17T]|uniref:GNAT family N-acetyltransferase n=1 Tax=Marilutibacter chinensis TaxID=2912247 RepID=A0ABS9HTQ4_9GAMM|nr:GNAT family N-acetyltransferase [Lysobacter chinensis]
MTTASQPAGLPSFPHRTIQPAPLTGRGLRLRHATDPDLPWLRRLYAATRAQEMAQLPWPEAVRQTFLDQQFDLQHRHYVTHYGDGDFLIVEDADGPVGRYYLHRSTPEHLIVDISLLPERRNRGIGAALIAASQAHACAEGCGMHLHVAVHNPAARRLYERLGFVVITTEGAHHRMRWSPPAIDF